MESFNTLLADVERSRQRLNTLIADVERTRQRLNTERANTERANTERAREPLVNPFQVHQAFVPSLENFKELLPLLNGGDTDNFDSLFTGEGGCRFVDKIDDELIKMYVSDVPGTDTTTLKRDLKRNLLPTITKLQTSRYNLCEKVKPIGSTKVYDVTMKEFILASFRFAKRRTSGYKNRFIEFFTQDCLTAYEGGGSGAISCIGGILERFILVIPMTILDANEITSNDSESNLKKINNIIVGAKISKEELQSMMAQCNREINSDPDPNAEKPPIEDYIKCMKEKILSSGSSITEKEILDYVNEVYAVFGGRKRRNRRNRTNKRNKKNKRNTRSRR
jgi:hypothetical protein